MDGSPQVVVLHGLGRTPLAMLPLAIRLRRAGFPATNLGYVAARRPLGVVASEVAARIDAVVASLDPRRPVHFVTHSLGGLLARHWLAAHPARAEGARLVQLAPPNQGSWFGKLVRTLPLVRAFPGPTIDDLWSPEPPRGVEVGVIAGFAPAPWIPDPSDGIVRVAETWLPGSRDWIELRHFHSFIMNASDTAANAVEFLRAGRFLRDAPRLTRDGEGRIGKDGGVPWK